MLLADLAAASLRSALLTRGGDPPEPPEVRAPPALLLGF
jgi:hypothetical protein